ncbi:MAG: hypothetical protein E3J81_05580, partial [Dehalococcoidia bacterium]
MDWVTIIAIAAAIIGIPLTIFGAYIGVRQLLEWRRVRKDGYAVTIQQVEETLRKEIGEQFTKFREELGEGIHLYVNGLPWSRSKPRRQCFEEGLTLMRQAEWQKAIDTFRRC